MKNIHFAAIFAVLAFFACTSANDEEGGSSPSSSSNPSSSSTPSSSSSLEYGVCYINDFKPGVEYCIKGKNGAVIPKENCDKIEGIIKDSCPPGENLVCDKGNEYYFYGQVIADNHLTCEYMFNEQTPSSSSSSFSSSSSSSSSSASNPSSGSGACYNEENEFCSEAKSGFIITRPNCEITGGTFMNSCPSEQRMCEDATSIYYLYGQTWDGWTCNKFLDLFE